MVSFPKQAVIIIFVLFLGALSACRKERHEKPDYGNSIGTEVDQGLRNLTEVWYPRVIDRENGGYWSDFSNSWKREGPQHKMIVSQARHIWSASVLSEYYGDTSYLNMAAHGYRFLKDHMWDHQHGGFFTQKGIDGDSLRLMSVTKSAYGNAFAIYGLATYYRAAGDTAALNLAKKTFAWLEAHAYDPEYGGYFDVLQQDGSWMLKVDKDTARFENFNRKDWKDQNSSIHLMEAFTALYEVWPDSLLQKRLEEMLMLIRDTITTENGYLTLHLERDWKPVSFRDSSEAYRSANFYLDHVSFGHDVETAFLMLETSHILGRTNDSITLIKAKKMVDHALDNGWDSRLGGFFDGGYYPAGKDSCVIKSAAKVWWAQAEALNALLLMSRLFPEEGRYKTHFLEQWKYIRSYLVDQEHGGWYHEGLDSNPMAATHAKANVWKTSYHNVRSLMNVAQMLEGTFPLTDGPIHHGTEVAEFRNASK